MSEFWKQKYLENTPKEIRDVSATDNKSDNIKIISSFPYSDNSILYHNPIMVGNEIVIPFKSVRHNFEDIDKVLVKINNDKIYSQKVDSFYQLIHLNPIEFKKSTNNIQFGYMIKSDSINESYHLYSSIIPKSCIRFS